MFPCLGPPPLQLSHCDLKNESVIQLGYPLQGYEPKVRYPSLDLWVSAAGQYCFFCCCHLPFPVMCLPSTFPQIERTDLISALIERKKEG